MFTWPKKKQRGGFFGEMAFSSQSQLFESLLNCSDWLDKSRPSKRLLLFGHVNKLFIFHSPVHKMLQSFKNQPDTI